MTLVVSTVTVDSVNEEFAAEVALLKIEVKFEGNAGIVAVEAAAADAEELKEADVTEAAELMADTADELTAEASETGQTVVVAYTMLVVSSSAVE